MDSAYLNLLNAIPNLEYPMMWRIILLLIIRMAPMVSIVPFLGGKLIPGPARAGLAIALASIFLPLTLYYNKDFAITDNWFLGLAFKELVIGYVIAFIASIPFFVVQSSGIFIDYMRGSSMLMSQDPLLQNQASSIGIMFNYYLIVMFYAFDGLFLFFDAVSTSLEVFPIAGGINPAIFSLANPLWKTTMGIMGYVFSMSLQIAAPSIVAILMAEMFLGIANRLAPQVQIAFLGMSLKSLLGLMLLWSAWFIILKQMSTSSIDWITNLNILLKQIPLYAKS